MKFVCKRADLFHGIQTAFSAVSNKNTLPILSNLLMETEGDAVKLTATDLEVSIHCSVAAEIEESGSITIPAKKILDIVRELPDKEVSFKTGDNHIVTVSCERSVFKINGLPKDEYPVLPKVKKDSGINLPQAILQDMIKKTIFAVSTDETRYVLNGVLLFIEKNKVGMVATDGHRLAYIENEIGKTATQKIDHIIPAKALQELNKVLEGEGEINIQLNELNENKGPHSASQIIFSTNTIVLMSRLIDGQFPNYEQVIPKKSEKKINLLSETFTAATRRVALMASDKSNSVKYTFNKNTLMIMSNTPEVGEAQEEIEIVYAEETLTVAYNAKYILDVMKNIGSEEFVFELTSNLNPGLIRPKDEKTHYLSVIMPMRI